MAVNDFVMLSTVFTNTVPSRVQVSVSLPSRRRFRASQAIFPRVFVRSSLMKTRVPFSFLPFRMMALLTLCVVKLTIMSRGAVRSSVLRPTRSRRSPRPVSPRFPGYARYFVVNIAPGRRTSLLVTKGGCVAR